MAKFGLRKKAKRFIQKWVIDIATAFGRTFLCYVQDLWNQIGHQR